MAKKIIKTVEQPTAIPTVHVALIAEDGRIIHHEELPAAAAPHRRYMFELTAELDVRDIPGAERKTYLGETWPPPGQEEVDGRLLPAPRPALAPEK